MADKSYGPKTQFVWEVYADAESAPLREIYHGSVRSELLDLIPRPPRVLLDVGCAEGASSAYLKEQYPNCRAYGIELNVAAANVAKSRLDGVLTRPLEELNESELPFGKGGVDLVILADVLQCMANPWRFLTLLKSWLSDDAVILVSLPNVRNLALINELVRGYWTYAESGLLDVAHLRFFTQHEIARLFDETGYEVLLWERAKDQRTASNFFGVERVRAVIDRLSIADLRPEEAEELGTYQFYLLVQPKGGAGFANAGGAAVEPVRLAERSVAVERENEERQRKADEGYKSWTLARTLQPWNVAWYSEALARVRCRPHIALAALVLPGRERAIVETIASLVAQLWANWSLILVGVQPAPCGVDLPSNVAWHELGDDDDSIVLLSSLLMASGADWLGVIEAGDRLAPEALASFVLGIDAHSQWCLVYSDEDCLDEHLRRSRPRFKPDFNLDLLRSCNYIGGIALIRADVFSELKGFDPEMEGAEDYDLWLKVYERFGGAGVGHLPSVLYHRDQVGGHVFATKEELSRAAKVALLKHLERSGIVGEVMDGPLPATFNVGYSLVRQPLVSIVIPTKDQPQLLKDCVESVLTVSSYRNFELILVDNQTSDQAALDLMLEWESSGVARVVRYPYPFNYSAQVNLGASIAKGEYLVLLNNDVRITQSDWLQGMLRHALRPDVGVVGVRLLYPNGLVQHAGVVLGIGHQPAEHPFIGAKVDEEGYLGRALLTQNYSAVTAACMMVQKTLFDELHGLNAEALKIAFNDVDFCLRVGRAGRLIVWTPSVSLVHGGSVSQKAIVSDNAEEKKKENAERYSREQEYMLKMWAGQIGNDPAYNPNLALAERTFAMEVEPALTVSPEWRPRARVIAMPADHYGCGEYRIKAPMRALIGAGKVQGWATERYYGPTELLRLRPDSIVLQRQIFDHQLESLKRYQRQTDALKVFEIDDLLDNVPTKAFGDSRILREHRERLEKALAFCDRFVVSTPELAAAYEGLSPDIRVVPNFIEIEKWGYLQPRRLGGGKPRVGWGGGGSHTGDLEMIADVIRILAGEVDWVFFGMCPDALRPYVREFHRPVPIDGYPLKLASLNLDLAIAPLEDHPFNEAKSHLRLLEYGILGYPVVCTDIAPYRGDFPVIRVKNRTEEWVDAIRAAVADRDRLADAGNRMKLHVLDNWVLENNVDRWLDAWLP